jgi:hypothetical protein
MTMGARAMGGIMTGGDCGMMIGGCCRDILRGPISEALRKPAECKELRRLCSLLAARRALHHMQQKMQKAMNAVAPDTAKLIIRTLFWVLGGFASFAILFLESMVSSVSSSVLLEVMLLLV